MANANINITIDEEALRKQVQGILTEELQGVALSLRLAADRLDPGFLERLHQDLDSEYERGLKDGGAATNG